MSGFERGDYGRLADLHRAIREKFNYVQDEEKQDLILRWTDASTLRNIGRSGITQLSGDCIEFSLVSLDHARQFGFHSRLVLCRTETGQEHIACEVASTDYHESYFFDSRQLKVVTATDLKRYRFIAVSPWNLEPTDQRPWLKVKQ